MTAQEDNATYEALKRAASVKRVDLSRVAVLRTGSTSTARMRARRAPTTC
jgi:purine nucleoside permease